MTSLLDILFWNSVFINLSLITGSLIFHIVVTNHKLVYKPPKILWMAESTSFFFKKCVKLNLMRIK